MSSKLKPIEVYSLFELEIERIVTGGYGLGHYAGKVVLVPLASPGDRLKVKPYKIHENFCKAEIVEIIKPSPYRIAPVCKYFGECGGCDFQHLNYETQLEVKVEIIKDCLRRIGKIDPPDKIPIIHSDEMFGYRLRAHWHFSLAESKAGYFRRDSNEIVDIELCPILSPNLQKFLIEMRGRLESEKFSNDKGHVEVVSNETDVSVASDVFKDEPRDIQVKVGDNIYFLNARSFFQANRFLLEKLIELAIEGASGTTCLDLYCGVGFFTLPLAKNFKTVLAVEQARESILLAMKSAKAAGLENIKFHSQKVRDFLKQNQQFFDFILIDPPRTGVEKEVLESLLKLAPFEICYVSCDPATLARDLRRLSAKYKITSVKAIDMFPQTHHIETVVRLRKI